ncbi:MAG: flagellar basal body P-ring formation chaperone FlgA [Thermodesulfobacteriota bacterium]|nr:flagellar basal body P-ring formation chaperone FlgA [Thermodesulfobacteriota bacterium]
MTGVSKSYVLLWCLLALLLSTTIVLAQQVTLKPSVVVGGKQITLGMLATIDPPSPALARQRLSRAPALAKTLDLKREQIEETLRRHGVDVAGLTWLGASVVRIEVASQTVTANAIQRSIDQFLLNAQSRLSHVTFTFVPFSPPDSIVLPPGTIQVDVVPSVRNIIGSRHFNLVYRIDGKAVKNISVRGTLHVDADVVVARRKLRRGAIISADDVEIVSLDVSRLRDPLHSLTNVVGKQVARSLHAGRVVQRKNVKYPPLVEKGAFIKIIARRGGMLLTAIGIARQDGQLDEVIRVQNSRSQKEIRARVSGNGLVEVEF